MFMRTIFIIFCLIFSACEPYVKCTEQNEYVEKNEWNHEKGIVKTYKASWSAEWESIR